MVPAKPIAGCWSQAWALCGHLPPRHLLAPAGVGGSARSWQGHTPPPSLPHSLALSPLPRFSLSRAASLQAPWAGWCVFVGKSLSPVAPPGRAEPAAPSVLGTRHQTTQPPGAPPSPQCRLVDTSPPPPLGVHCAIFRLRSILRCGGCGYVPRVLGPSPSLLARESPSARAPEPPMGSWHPHRRPWLSSSTPSTKELGGRLAGVLSPLSPGHSHGPRAGQAGASSGTHLPPPQDKAPPGRWAKQQR